MSQIDDINGMINDATNVLIAQINQTMKQLSVNVTALSTPPPAVVVPPVQVTPAYNKTIRYGLAAAAYRFKDQQPGIAKTIPPAKGNVPMTYSGDTNAPLGVPAITKDGLLFIQNQANTPYSAMIGNSPMYPRESWMVLEKPPYFMFEKLVESPFYIGDLGNPKGIRFTSDDTNVTNWNWFPNAVWPVNQPFVFRTRLTTIPGKTDYVTVEFWINNVKQTAVVPIKTWYRSNWSMGIGTDTNNEYIGWYEWFDTNRALTDAEALSCYNEIVAEYGVATMPYADNIQFSVINGQRTASYRFNTPQGFAEDTTKRIVKWVNMPNGSPTNTSYNNSYVKNEITVADNFIGRVEITVFDVKGNWFSIPASAAWQST